MDTKFIGTDGFGKIESISGTKKNTHRKSVKLNTTQKTVRFIRRAAKCVSKKVKTNRAPKAQSKPQLLERHYRDNRRDSAFSAEIISLKSIMPKRRQYAHSAPKKYRPHGFVKKRAVLAVTASLAAVVLSAVTVAGALDSPTPVQTAASAVSPAPKAAPAPASFDEASVINIETASGLIGSELYALTVDGEQIGVTSEVEKLRAALRQYLDDYRKDYDDTTTTEFANKVAVERVSGVENISTEELRSADELIKAAQDKFSVMLSTDWYYETEIDYDVDVTYDDTKDSDYEKVITEGKAGVCRVNIRLTYLDGEFYDSQEINTEVTKKPVTEKVIRGSKQGKPEVEEKKSSSGETTGSFIWPVTHTKGITTYFEMRWGSMHHGIDIAGGGDYGQPIVASDGGTVIWSGYDESGYGNYVIIDHGNGFQTLYGHACELAVSEGQQVDQGDVIAYVGSTGFSTGPHLHFEIRVDGERVDPFNYLD